MRDLLFSYSHTSIKPSVLVPLTLLSSKKYPKRKKKEEKSRKEKKHRKANE